MASVSVIHRCFKGDVFVADYISMYQVQREKLAQKYKDSLKDESIRSLSTQLQVNRVSTSFNSKLSLVNEMLHLGL